VGAGLKTIVLTGRPSVSSSSSIALPRPFSKARNPRLRYTWKAFLAAENSEGFFVSQVSLGTGLLLSPRKGLV
jgi:hypothetical protein